MLNTKDSSATIMSNTIWAEKIKSFAHNYKFYTPLTHKESVPIPNDSNLADTQRLYSLIGIEHVNGAECYHIQIKILPSAEEDDPMKTLRQEYDFWINKDDFIPVQYDVTFDLVMNNDTMYQYERTILTKYELNVLKDERILTMNAIPKVYKLKDYVPYKRPELLPLDTTAPHWELLSLHDEKVSLDSLKGKLVLVDFFYKSCYPCMLALPSLQALNEKYKDQGLEVIGIDPYDSKENGLEEFLAKRNVSYTVLLGGKDAALEYRVSAYPTMFLIDRSGKIIFIQVGYGDETEKTLEDLIIKNL